VAGGFIQDNTKKDEAIAEPSVQHSIHPGEILIEEFLKPMGISQYRLAKDISVPPRRINEIVHGKRSILADIALRLRRFFGISPQFWLNLQTLFDLEVTEHLLAERFEKEVQVLSSTAA
jgi:addiction module HigA family antidote